MEESAVSSLPKPALAAANADTTATLSAQPTDADRLRAAVTRTLSASTLASASFQATRAEGLARRAVVAAAWQFEINRRDPSYTKRLADVEIQAVFNLLARAQVADLARSQTAA